MDAVKSGKIVTSTFEGGVNTKAEVTDIVVAQNSVELVLNAKGGVQFTVKCYAETLTQAEADATRIFRELAAKYKVDLPSNENVPTADRTGT